MNRDTDGLIKAILHGWAIAVAVLLIMALGGIVGMAISGL